MAINLSQRQLFIMEYSQKMMGLQVYQTSTGVDMEKIAKDACLMVDTVLQVEEITRITNERAADRAAKAR